MYSFCFKKYVEHLGDANQEWEKYNKKVKVNRHDRQEDFFTYKYIKENKEMEQFGILNCVPHFSGMPDIHCNVRQGSPLAKLLLDWGVIPSASFNDPCLYKNFILAIEIKNNNVDWNHSKNVNSAHTHLLLCNGFNPKFEAKDKNGRVLPVLYIKEDCGLKALPPGIRQSVEVTRVQEHALRYVHNLVKDGVIDSWQEANYRFEHLCREDVPKISDPKPHTGLKIPYVQQRIFRAAISAQNGKGEIKKLFEEDIHDYEKYERISPLDPRITSQPEIFRGRRDRKPDYMLASDEDFKAMLDRHEEEWKKFREAIRNEFKEEEFNKIGLRMGRMFAAPYVGLPVNPSFSPPESVREELNDSISEVWGKKEKQSRQSTRNKDNKTCPIPISESAPKNKAKNKAKNKDTEAKFTSAK